MLATCSLLESPKQNPFMKKTKQILVHPGAVLDEVGIVRTAFTGGPLGELVQWSDLISTLHLLGHHLHLSASLNNLRM